MIETPNDDAVWKEWKGLWRQSPPVDVSGLVRRSRTAGWRLLLAQGLEALLVIGAVGVGIYMISRGGTPRVLFGVFVTVFSLWALWTALAIRRGSWAAEANTTEALLELEIRRARAAIHYARLHLKAIPAGLVMAGLALWIIADSSGGWSALRVFEVAWAAGYTAFWLAGIVFGMRWHARRKGRELEILQRLRKDLGISQDV